MENVVHNTFKYLAAAGAHCLETNTASYAT
jgi:hypothetical protein